MDHDAPSAIAVRPNSVKSSEIVDAFSKIVNNGLQNLEETVASDCSYESNFEGHLAWDLSLFVRAACKSWSATGCPDDLRRIAAWSQRLYDTTDLSRGVRDWRGRSGPVWSAGPRYTAAFVNVRISERLSIGLQGAADAIRVERPSQTTAILHALIDNSVVWSSPEASLVPENREYLPDVLSERSSVAAVLVRGLRQAENLSDLPAGDFTLKPQLAAHLVHTGLIARSLTFAAKTLISSNYNSATRGVSPDDLMQLAYDALSFHDDEMVRSGGVIWYRTPQDFPGRRLALDVPHNHIADIATTWLELGDQLNDEELKAKGRLLASRFLSEIDSYMAGELDLPWYYYPVDSDAFSGVSRSFPIAERKVAGVSRVEDSSHVTLRVRALGEWKHLDESLVSDSQVQAVSETLRLMYVTRAGRRPTIAWLPLGQRPEIRQGHSNEFPGAWSTLAPWHRNVMRTVNSLSYHYPPSRLFGATLLSATEVMISNMKGS